MGKTGGRNLEMGIGLVPVLRAGLGMVEGIWEMMPSAEVWHIGLYRDERTLLPMQYYANKPVHRACRLPDPRPDAGHRRLGRGHVQPAQRMGRHTSSTSA